MATNKNRREALAGSSQKPRNKAWAAFFCLLTKRQGRTPAREGLRQQNDSRLHDVSQAATYVFLSITGKLLNNSLWQSSTSGALAEVAEAQQSQKSATNFTQPGARFLGSALKEASRDIKSDSQSSPRVLVPGK